MIPTSYFFTVACIIFVIGFFGIFLNRRNIILMLLSIELMLLSVNINFVAFSSSFGVVTGQIYSIFVLAIAAAEGAIGLAIIVVYYRNLANIDADEASKLKG